MRSPLRPVARRALAAQSDERLVRLLRDGHAPAFEEIVRRYRGPLIAFAAAIVTISRAEDVVQAALARAHRSLLADEREISLRSWLFTITRNGALNLIRDEPRWSELDPERDGEQHPAAIVEQREELDAMVTAICALPESQRQALVMREMEGAGHAEIAAKLHTSPHAVRGLIFRARTTLRDGVGALIPLPLMRWLLADAAAAGSAAAAAGGTGGAVLASGAGKVGVAVATAVVAVGAGKALQDRRGDDPKNGPEAASAAQPRTSDGTLGGSGPSAGAGRTPTSTGDGGTSGEGTAESGDGRSDGSSSGDDDAAARGERGDDSSGHGSGDSSGPGSGDDDGGGDSSGPGSGGDDDGGGDSSGSGSGGSDSSGSGSIGSGSSGSGSGSSGSGSDSSGSGSGSSGSGSSGSGSSGSGSGSDEPDPVDEPEDNSGSGSSGSG